MMSKLALGVLVCRVDRKNVAEAWSSESHPEICVGLVAWLWPGSVARKLAQEHPVGEFVTQERAGRTDEKRRIGHRYRCQYRCQYRNREVKFLIGVPKS